MDFWERVIHSVLVGDSDVEGASREGRASSGGEEEDEAVSQRYHDTVLSSNLS